jgi:ABC-type oligopeptide transport system substrate-binding subunit
LVPSLITSLPAVPTSTAAPAVMAAPAVARAVPRVVTGTRAPLAASVSEFDATDTGATLAIKLVGSNTNTIKRLRFLDAAGTELESDTNGSMTSSDESEYSYTLKAKATTATVEIEIWQNLQTAQVPFTLTAALDAAVKAEDARASAGTATPSATLLALSAALKGERANLGDEPLAILDAFFDAE